MTTTIPEQDQSAVTPSTGRLTSDLTASPGLWGSIKQSLFGISHPLSMSDEEGSDGDSPGSGNRRKRSASLSSPEDVADMRGQAAPDLEPTSAFAQAFNDRPASEPAGSFASPAGSTIPEDQASIGESRSSIDSLLAASTPRGAGGYGGRPSPTPDIIDGLMSQVIRDGLTPDHPQETAADRAPHMSVAQEKASLLRGEASEQLLVETQEGDSIPINSTELAADSQAASGGSTRRLGKAGAPPPGSKAERFLSRPSERAELLQGDKFGDFYVKGADGREDYISQTELARSSVNLNSQAEEGAQADPAEAADSSEAAAAPAAAGLEGLNLSQQPTKEVSTERKEAAYEAADAALSQSGTASALPPTTGGGLSPERPHQQYAGRQQVPTRTVGDSGSLDDDSALTQLRQPGPVGGYAHDVAVQPVGSGTPVGSDPPGGGDTEAYSAVTRVPSPPAAPATHADPSADSQTLPSPTLPPPAPSSDPLPDPETLGRTLGSYPLPPPSESEFSVFSEAPTERTTLGGYNNYLLQTGPRPDSETLAKSFSSHPIPPQSESEFSMLSEAPTERFGGQRFGSFGALSAALGGSSRKLEAALGPAAAESAPGDSAANEPAMTHQPAGDESAPGDSAVLDTTGSTSLADYKGSLPDRDGGYPEAKTADGDESYHGGDREIPLALVKRDNVQTAAAPALEPPDRLGGTVVRTSMEAALPEAGSATDLLKLPVKTDSPTEPPTAGKYDAESPYAREGDPFAKHSPAIYALEKAQQQMEEQQEAGQPEALFKPSPNPTPDLPDFPEPPPEELPDPPSPPTAGKRGQDAPSSIGNVFSNAANDVDPAVAQSASVEIPQAEPPTRSLSTPGESPGDASGLFQVSSAKMYSPEQVYGQETQEASSTQGIPSSPLESGGSPRHERRTPMRVTFSQELSEAVPTGADVEPAEAALHQQQLDEAAANSAGSTLAESLRNAALTTAGVAAAGATAAAAGTAAAISAAGSALSSKADNPRGDAQAASASQPSSFQPSDATFEEVARRETGSSLQSQDASFTRSSQATDEASQQQLGEAAVSDLDSAHNGSAYAQVEAHSSRAASRQQEQGEAVSQQQQRDEAAANSAGNTLVDALRNAAVTTAAGTAAAVTAAGSALTGSGTQQDAATGSAQADPVPQPSSFQPSNASFQEVARDRADLPAQAQTVSFTPSSQTFEEVTHQQLEQSPAEGSVPAHTDSARDSETEPQAAAPESSETVTSSEALPIDESSQPAAPGYADSARAAAPGYADSALDSLAGAAKGVAVGFGFSDGSANRVDDAHAATRQYLGLQPYEASSAGLQQLGSESPAPRREQDESARGAEDLPEATGPSPATAQITHDSPSADSSHSAQSDQLMQPDKDNLPQTDGQAPTSKSANESITGSTQPYSESVTGGAQSVGDGTAEGSYSTLGSQVAGVAAAALVAPVAAAGYLASAISSSGQATQPGSQAAAGSSDAVLTQPGADTLDPLGINTGGPAQTLIHRAPAASDPPAGKAGSRQPEASAAAAKPAASAATGGFDAPEGSYADRESYDEAAERPLASQGSYGRDGYSYDSPTSSYDITDDLPSVPGGGGDSFNRSTSQQVDTAAKQVKVASIATGLDRAANESGIDRGAAALKAVAAGDSRRAVALAASLPVPPAGQQDSRQPGAQLVEQAAAAAKQEGVIRGMDESLAGNASARAAHAMLTSAAPVAGVVGPQGSDSAFAGYGGFSESSPGQPAGALRIASTGSKPYDEFVDESALKSTTPDPSTPNRVFSGDNFGAASAQTLEPNTSRHAGGRTLQEPGEAAGEAEPAIGPESAIGGSEGASGRLSGQGSRGSSGGVGNRLEAMNVEEGEKPQELALPQDLESLPGGEEGSHQYASKQCIKTASGSEDLPDACEVHQQQQQQQQLPAGRAESPVGSQPEAGSSASDVRLADTLPVKGAAAPNGSAFGDAPSRQLGEAASSRPVFSSAVGESAFAYPSKGTADSTPAPAEGYSSEYSDARGSVAVPVGENRSQQAVRQPDTASAIAPGGHFQPPAGDSAVSIGRDSAASTAESLVSNRDSISSVISAPPARASERHSPKQSAAVVEQEIEAAQKGRQANGLSSKAPKGAGASAAGPGVASGTASAGGQQAAGTSTATGDAAGASSKSGTKKGACWMCACATPAKE